MPHLPSAPTLWLIACTTTGVSVALLKDQTRPMVADLPLPFSAEPTPQDARAAQHFGAFTRIDMSDPLNP